MTASSDESPDPRHHRRSPGAHPDNARSRNRGQLAGGIRTCANRNSNASNPTQAWDFYIGKCHKGTAFWQSHSESGPSQAPFEEDSVECPHRRRALLSASRPLLERLHGKLGTPGIEPAPQGDGVDPPGLELLRHTDAGGFIVSGAIGDHEPVNGLRPGPFGDLVWLHADTLWDLHSLPLVP